MDLVCLIGFLCVQFYLVSSAGFDVFSVRINTKKRCSYEGYVPGGKVTITDIEAPQIIDSSNERTASILGHISDATGLGKEVLEGAAEAFKNVAKVAPYLGVAIGIFSGIAGIISGEKELSAEDVLEKTNAAISELVADMNEKFDDMKGYIDVQIAQSEREVIEREYKSLFELVKECIRVGTKEESTNCQKNSNKIIRSKIHKFAVFDTTLLGSNPESLTTTQVVKIEAYLSPFRNYADLVILSTAPLIGLYKGVDSTDGRQKYNFYSTQLKEKAEFFIKYARAAMKAIHRMHNNVNSCNSTFTCDEVEKKYEGAFSTNTYDQTECSCIMDPSTKQRCKIQAIIRADGQHPSSWRTTSFSKDKKYTTDQALKGWIERLAVADSAATIDKEQEGVINAYWQKNLLDSEANWKTAIKLAEPGTKIHVAKKMKE